MKEFMKRQLVITAALTLNMSVGAHAQPPDLSRWLAQIDWTKGRAISDAFGNQTVTGKPFSATEDRHSVQVLGNGTRIESSESNRLYRDNDGRTRVEDIMSGLISIADPVAGFRVELDPKTKIAQRTFFLRTPSSLALRQYGTRVELNQPGGRGRGGVPASGSDSTPERGPNTAGMPTENLGMQMVNGVWAQGTRTTTTIPKGQIGNDREIKVITEQWFSNDLNLLVKSVNSDPRFGDTIYQLTKIVQTAPDSSLFQIPADYNTTTGVPAPGQPGGRGGRGGPPADQRK